MARTVELFIDGNWVDVTAEPRYVLADDPITITRGADSQSTKASPGSATLTLFDRDQDGRWSNRVPTATYWGKLGRNTPIRIKFADDVTEDFEDASLDITTSGDWARSNTTSHGGSWSFKSASIGHNASSTVDITVPVGMNWLEYWYRLSTEEGFDFFTVLLDGRLVFTGSGETDWLQATFDVTGVSVVTFTYTKDPAATGVLDAVFVDDIVFSDVRCVMEVPEWTPRWEVGDKKVRVPIKAAGILNRLTQGAKNLGSALSRSVLSAANTTPREYWRLDDGSNATQLASSVPGRRPMTLFGTTTPTLATVAGPDGDQGTFAEFVSSSAYLGGATADGLDLVGATSWTIEFWFRATKTSVADAQVVMATWHTDGGSYGFQDWLVYAARIGSSEGVVLVVDHTPLAATSFSYSGSSVSMMDGEWHQVRVTAINNGSSVTIEFYVDGTLRDSDPLNATRPTVGNPKDITLGDPGVAITGAYPLSNTASLSMSHWQVYATNVATDHYDAGTGYAGEAAGRRVERLCGEEGVAFTSVGDLDNTAPMGPQRTNTLVALLEEASVADQGMLFETRTELGLTYRTRVSLYNQVGPLLDYSAGHVAPDLEPDEGTSFVRNYVTASRPDGSSAVSTLDEATDLYHTLTTQPPPAGVGVYDRGAVDAVVETDDQLQPIADWVRHLGTWDELRYPQLSVEFAAPVWDSNPTLAAELAELDSGDQLRLDGLPTWLPPDQVALMVQGSVEVIGTHTRTLTWNLTPGWPWEVWELDSGGSTLAAAVSSAATSLKIATSVGPEWSTVDEPYHIIIDGEAMTVTAMTTDTPAFIAAGTVAHAVNANVTPGLPAGITPDIGQTLWVWAAIRNSGTGTPNTPTGYTLMANASNARLFAKYYVTGDVAPTISFAGGAANQDTSARMFALSGVSLEHDDGDYGVTNASPQTQLNSSAQNIAYPALSARRANCMLLLAAWKQDDWTSVATVGDAEIMDNATTSGDDQGIVADYHVHTVPDEIAAGSWTVTGGASAISRSAVVMMRPLQTATVTRAVNGVSKSIAAAKPVHGWRLGVIAL